MKREKLDDEQLLDVLRRKEESAGQYVWGQLGREREQALKEYHRQPYGNEEDGWSNVVTSDIQDSVEWMLPALLNIFTATDRAVSFEPTRANDVDGAEQATDVCNYIFYKQNSGFLCLYSAIKDALMLRNCAVMWRKEPIERVEYFPFAGMTSEELAMAMQENDKIMESNTDTIIGADGLPVEVYTGKICRTYKENKIVVESFSPEELLVEREWTSPLLDDCPYVARLISVACSDLKQMGFDVTPADLKGSTFPEENSQGLRGITQDSDHVTDDYSNEDDGALTEGWLRIEFVMIDADGDGVAERRCILRLEDRILSNEICDHVQIATASPVLNTHRWDGVSIADLVTDVQRMHTEMVRQVLNNLYLTNNPRAQVLTDSNWSPMANIDDMLDSRPGGVVRVRQAGAVNYETVPFSAAASMPMLEYIQGMRENRTGVSRVSQGLNPDSLNNTATGRAMDMSAAMQRIELIARIFAEILVKPIFKGIFKLLTDGDMQKIAFRLRDEFVEYDPKEWRDGYDMSINVGLGSSDKNAQVAKLQGIMLGQEKLMQLGIATPKNIYHAASRLIEASGFKDVQNFITDPATIPPKPPQMPIELQIKQMELAAQAQQDDKRHQEKLAELQANLQLQASNDQRDAEREQNRVIMEAQAKAVELQFQDKWKELENNTRVLVAEINKRGEIQKTAMQINATNTDEMEPEEYSEDGMPVSRMSIADLVNAVNQNLAQLLQVQQMSHQELVQQITRPKQVIRDANGRVQGVA